MTFRSGTEIVELSSVRCNDVDSERRYSIETQDDQKTAPNAMSEVNEEDLRAADCAVDFTLGPMAMARRK